MGSMKPQGGFGGPAPGAPPQHQAPRPPFNPRHMPPNAAQQMVAGPHGMMSQPHRHAAPPGAGPHHRPAQFQQGQPGGMGPRVGHQHQQGNRSVESLSTHYIHCVTWMVWLAF